MRVILFFATIALLTSCSSDEQSVDEIRTAELPEIELNHLFTLEEPEGIFFERIQFIQTDAQGRIFLADQEANHILVYDETGDFITTIGREGAGSLDEGLINDDLVEFREMGYLVRDDGMMNGIPFGRTTLLARSHDGKLYMTWNENFEVAVYDAQLKLADSIQAEIPNQPILTEERREQLVRLDQFRSLASEHMPDTKPVAEAMWVDPQQNIWLQTHDSPEYLVLDSSGEPIGSFDLEGERRILHVDDERVYTVLSDDEGYAVDVYEIRL